MWTTYRIVYTDKHEETITKVEYISTQLGCLTFYGNHDIHTRHFQDIQYFEVVGVYPKTEN